MEPARTQDIHLGLSPWSCPCQWGSATRTEGPPRAAWGRPVDGGGAGPCPSSSDPRSHREKHVGHRALGALPRVSGPWKCGSRRDTEKEGLLEAPPLRVYSLGGRGPCILRVLARGDHGPGLRAFL